MKNSEESVIGLLFSEDRKEVLLIKSKVFVDGAHNLILDVLTNRYFSWVLNVLECTAISHSHSLLDSLFKNDSEFWFHFHVLCCAAYAISMIL